MERKETLPHGGSRREHDTGSEPMPLDYTPRTTFIYALVDPHTDAVRYVGKTENVAGRFQAHCGERGSSHKHRWIAQLRREGLKPVLNLLEECGDDWPTRERFWIQHYRGLGRSLTNITDGGEGVSGMKHSPESCAKMSASHFARWSEPEYREERIALIQSAQSTPEYRARLCERMASSEVREKIAETVKSRWAEKEVRERMTAALRSAHKTEEAKAHHSKASKRLWDDPEYREKTMNAAKIGWAKRKARIAETEGGLVSHSGKA